MGDETKIRLAAECDIDDMIHLISLVFAMEKDFQADKDKQRRGLQLILQSGSERHLWVAEKNGRVVGMCSAQLLVSTAESGWKALVEDVAVDEVCRRQGIGRKLLGEVVNWARIYGVTRVDLLADRNNEKGLSFYRQLGWKTTNLIALQKNMSKGKDNNFIV